LTRALTNALCSQLVHTQSETTSRWTKEKLNDSELNEIEDQYLNLANYSHKLIRAGALPGGKKGSGGAGGIYYSIDKVVDADDDVAEEALEAIAKRRAVIKDSWDFYRMICSLLRDRNKYAEVFRRMQLDPVYPYLNSMTGLNDPGDVGYENLDKQVIQRDLPEYGNMTKKQVAEALVRQAEVAMPSLVEICKALAGSLGMEEVGVGPVKDASSAIRKAEKKYGGDLLKVTDYCRALLVVKDLPSLLALLELARDSFGPLITRVKMSTLKADHRAKPGGYRDCIINVELKGHICEIQVHLWPMWIICGVDGFRHYRHCVEYNTDSFEDAYDALDGLDRKTMAELIVMAEEAVAETPLDNLEWYHEKYILDYFAEAGLFMKHGLDVWAEITFRHLIRLRTLSPDIGPDHHETIILYKYLAQSLRAQDKYDEAKEVMQKVHTAEVAKSNEEKEAEKSLWESFGEVYDMVVDPNRKEREDEQKFRVEVKQSKKQWRRIRNERFPFLDVDADEKKVDESDK
jgi:tetratricopeptide (TPR) repeat protein